MPVNSSVRYFLLSPCSSLLALSLRVPFHRCKSSPQGKRCIFQTASRSSSDFEIYEYRGSRAAIADRLKENRAPLYLRRNFRCIREET